MSVFLSSGIYLFLDLLQAFRFFTPSKNFRQIFQTNFRYSLYTSIYIYTYLHLVAYNYLHLLIYTDVHFILLHELVKIWGI